MNIKRMQIYNYKRELKVFTVISTLLLMLMGLFFFLPINVEAGQVAHKFYIRLPDGSREPLAGASIRSFVHRGLDDIKASSGQCVYEGYPLRYIPGNLVTRGNTCATGVGCYDGLLVAPYLPYSFNSNEIIYTSSTNNNVSPSVTSFDASFIRFNGISGGQTFTEKYPWFPFEEGNPRGSNTAYWTSRVLHTNPDFERVRARYYNNTNIGAMFGTEVRQQQRGRAWNSIPGYPGYNNGQMRWYGQQNRLPFMPVGVREVANISGGENGYFLTMEWTLNETNPQEVPSCGNGIIETGEACDNGDQNGVACDASQGDCTSCTEQCTVEVSVSGPSCGDGVVEEGEACDNGDQNGVACTPEEDGSCTYCTTQCTNVDVIDEPVCGDGDVDPGEVCGEPGLSCSGDDICQNCSCTSISSGPICGDGVQEAGEECDDGNQTAGDGCSAACTIESSSCGNGTVDAGEECDDGNQVAGDGCSSSCSFEVTSTPTIIPDTALISDEADRVLIGFILIVVSAVIIRFNILINSFKYAKKFYKEISFTGEVRQTNINE